MKKVTWIIIAGAVVAAGIAGYIIWKKKRAALPEPETEEEETPAPTSLKGLIPDKGEQEWGVATKPVRSVTAALKATTPILSKITAQAATLKTATPNLATSKAFLTKAGTKPISKPALSSVKNK